MNKIKSEGDKIISFAFVTLIKYDFKNEKEI